MTFDKLKSLLANQLSIDENNIKMESRIIDDLGADSLDMVEMVMELENEFGITVPDEKTQELKTVADIVKFVDENK